MGNRRSPPAGGRRPLWARDGRELFYQAPSIGPTSTLMRVPVEARGTVWSAGTPVALFQGRYFTGTQGRAYDVSPDGRRFLMIKEAGADQGDARPQIIVVQHWTEELKRLVPAKLNAATTRQSSRSYDIVALIGAGGMGEVYRARDTRLDRTVAIDWRRRRLARRTGCFPGIQSDDFTAVTRCPRSSDPSQTVSHIRPGRPLHQARAAIESGRSGKGKREAELSAGRAFGSTVEGEICVTRSLL